MVAQSSCFLCRVLYTSLWHSSVMNDGTEFVLFVLNVTDGYMAQSGHE